MYCNRTILSKIHAHVCVLCVTGVACMLVYVALFVLSCFIYKGGYNERDYAWIAYQDWIYSKKFELFSDLLEYDSMRLDCGGLDTVANIRSALQHARQRG